MCVMLGNMRTWMVFLFFFIKNVYMVLLLLLILIRCICLFCTCAVSVYICVLVYWKGCYRLIVANCLSVCTLFAGGLHLSCPLPFNRYENYYCTSIVISTYITYIMPLSYPQKLIIFFPIISFLYILHS